MKKIGCILFIFCAIFLIFSCKREEEPQALGSVCGTVADKTTGEYIRNAGVELRSVGLKAVTGSDGYFEFPKVEEGTYYLYVTKTGYKDYKTNNIIVKANSDNKSVDIQMEKLPPALTILDDKQNEIDSLDFGAEADETIRSFIIFNNSEDVLNWSIMQECLWIKEINQTKGNLKANLPQTIHIKIDRSKLLMGRNYATLLITSDNGNKDLRLVATGSDFIKTLPATEVKAVSAILNGQITRRLPTEIKDFGFVYSLNPTPSLQNDAIRVQMQSEPIVAKYSYSILDLIPKRIYYFRAYASTLDSTFYGNEEQFSTTDGLPKVETSTIEVTDPYTAMGGGVVTSDGGYPVEMKGVCWSAINTAPTITDSHTNDGTGEGTFVSNISPLEAGARYFVRAYASNSQGISYGKTEQLDTPTGIPSLTTIQPTSTSNSITTGGNIISDGGFPIIERGVCYSKVNSQPSVENDNVITQGTGTGKYSIAITGLDVNTTYYVRAYAKNSYSLSYGDVYNIKTLYGSVTILTADIAEITANSAKGGVTITDLGGATLQSCGICWGTNSSPTINNSFVEAGKIMGTYSCPITNLKPNTQYYVRAYATTETGTTYGSAKSFTTIGGLPEVTTLSPTASATTITTGGIITSDAGYTVHTRGICYSSTNSSPTQNDNYVLANGSANTFNVTITNLSPSMTYYIRAFARNENGPAYGSVYSVTTLNGTIKITTSAVSNITSESATGGYQISATGGVTIQTAGICWSTSKSPTINDKTATGGTTIGMYSCTMSGLAAYTTYYVRAYAISELGVTYGSQISFATLAKSDYVDLGLPSGKKWRDHNESGRYDYDSASRSFGSKLPTKAQWDELVNLCTWRWTGSGYMVTGLNGNYIILPAEGVLSTNGALSGDGIFGYYRSSDKIDTDNAWYLIFSSSSKSFSGYSSHDKMSVRLIQ